ncbi:MAG: sigma-70 family RNA polymerase sigma factor [Acidimicrobiaceae bacterium]|nr:sigma-70 family RNA polymerase sigma factor [Acidimicrobiaceae bacterium]
MSDIPESKGSDLSTYTATDGDRSVEHKLANYLSFENLYRPEIVRLIYRRSGDRTLTEEITQETFLKAWRSIEVLLEHQAPLGWLITTAKNLLTDSYRRRMSEKRFVDTGYAQSAAKEGQSSNEVDELMDKLDLATAMRSLTADHREVIQLCVIEGLSTKTASERAGVPIGTIKSRLYYALRALRETLMANGYLS